MSIKIYKEMYGHSDAVRHCVRKDIPLFANVDILKSLFLSQKSLINAKLGDFVNLGVLFLTI